MKKLLIKKFLFIIVIVMWILITLFGIPSLIENGYQFYYGADDIFLLTGNLTGIPFIVSIAVLLIGMWLFSPYGLKGYFEEENGEGIKASFSAKRKCLIAVVTWIFACAAIVGSMFWFERYTLEGVEKHHFFSQKEYTWEEVQYLTLKADSHGVLVMELVMKDKTKYSFNGGILKAVEYTSKSFDEKFPEDVYDYMVWISRELCMRDIPMNVPDWEALNKKLDYDSWRELAEEIRQVYGETQKQ